MLTLRSTRVVLPNGARPACIDVRHGRIVEVRDYGAFPAGVDGLDAGDRFVLPGLVDSHVHVNEPGRTEWEGFAHATAAAAAGGITTIVDMPLNSVPATTTVAALEAKRRAAAGQCSVDVGFWGGVVPGNADQIEALAAAGVRGFKCFLAPSGVEDFDHVTEDDLRLAMPAVTRTGLPLLVHAESPTELLEPVGDRRAYATWLHSRPPAAEQRAIEMMIALAREFGTRVHIVHLANSAALPAIVAARGEGVRLSVETCPHYLHFAAETIAVGDTSSKCAPPIRESAHREALWSGLARGEIDLIATDHSPAPPAMKALDTGDFVAAWGGVASLDVALRVVWTEAAARGVSLERLAHWLSAAPAGLAGLGARKGRIAPGCDADFVVFDPDAEDEVDAGRLRTRHKITPYLGRRLRGRVCQTILRGELVYDAARDEFTAGLGQLL